MSEGATPSEAPVSSEAAPAEATPAVVPAEAPIKEAAPVEPAPAPVATPIAPSKLDNFLAELPETSRKDPMWEAYSERGVAGIAQDFSELQKLMGSQERISRPKDDAAPEEWGQFWNKLGRPETPEGYDLGGFKPPEGLPWDKGQQDRLVSKMHARGLTASQMSGALQDLADEQGATYNQGLEKARAFADQAEATLREEWGIAFPEKLEMAERVFVSAFGEDAATIKDVEIPGFGKFGAIPAVVRAFAKLGDSMREDTFVSGETVGSSGLMTQAQAVTEFQRMEKDPAVVKVLANRNDPEYAQMKLLWDRIAKTAYPD